MADLTNTQVVITKEICCRVLALNQLRLQAVNLGLSSTYISLLDNLLIQCLNLSDQAAIIALYDANYDDMIDQRTIAFSEFLSRVVDSVNVPPKTPSNIASTWDII